MSISNIGALIHVDPPRGADEAKKKILAAISEAKGDRKVAAKLLGTTHRSLYRFIERLRLWGDIDRLIDSNGFLKIVGPPRAAERIRDAVLAHKGNLPAAARALDMGIDSLRHRIGELGLWDDLNRRLAAIPGCRALKTPPENGERALAR